MAKLHELLAVMADTSNAAQAILKETAVTFTKRADHFKAQTRVVTYLAEGRQGENTTDTKAMVDTVDGKLGHTFGILGRHYNALFQLEESNQRANADLVVGDAVLIENAPAQFLLGMESRLKSLREVILAAPTLEPGMAWVRDETEAGLIYATDAPANFKTEKTIMSKVLYEATKEHPAQIREWTEDMNVARISTSHKSGMLTPHRKSEILDRVDKLLRAVKQARQRANNVDVEKEKVADKLFNYIMNG